MAETTPANIADELSDEFNSSIWTFYQTNLSARTRKEYLNIIRNFTKLTKTDPLKLTKEAAECYINELNARYTQKKLSYNTLVMRISVMRSLCLCLSEVPHGKCVHYPFRTCLCGNAAFLHL